MRAESQSSESRNEPEPVYPGEKHRREGKCRWTTPSQRVAGKATWTTSYRRPTPFAVI